MTDLLTENARLRAALGALVAIVEGIDGAMNHGTWRDDKGMRLKDTPQWVALYVALATPAPDAVQEAARFLAEAIDKDMQTFNRSLTAVDLSPDMPVRHFFSRALMAYADTLRAIAGGRT